VGGAERGGHDGVDRDLARAGLGAVRERAAAGRPLRYLVPEPVARFIEEKGIYA